jgi:hypothetical protein
MIICSLSGGLGNQLFQYATAKRLSMIHGADLVFDLNWFAQAPRNASIRVYELWHYPIAARLATDVEAVKLRRYNGRISRMLPFNKPWSAYFEKGFQFNPIVLNLSDNTYLHGYWQSHKYFEDVQQVINNELVPIESLSEPDMIVANLIYNSGECSVAVHVRRGDYVNLKSASDYHGACSINYYHSAFIKILEQIEHPHFFVFSDDITWAKKNIDFPGKVTFVSHNTAVSAFQDLRLMSLCTHKVIANSSFSWWAAWLKPDVLRNHNGMVIAPLKWFANSRVSLRDRFPSSWILI